MYWKKSIHYENTPGRVRPGQGRWHEGLDQKIAWDWWILQVKRAWYKAKIASGRSCTTACVVEAKESVQRKEYQIKSHSALYAFKQQDRHSDAARIFRKTSNYSNFSWLQWREQLDKSWVERGWVETGTATLADCRGSSPRTAVLFAKVVPILAIKHGVVTTGQHRWSTIWSRILTDDDDAKIQRTKFSRWDQITAVDNGSTTRPRSHLSSACWKISAIPDCVPTTKLWYSPMDHEPTIRFPPEKCRHRRRCRPCPERSIDSHYPNPSDVHNLMGNLLSYTSSSSSAAAAAARTLFTSIHKNLDRQRKEKGQTSRRSTKLLPNSPSIKNFCIPAESEISSFLTFTAVANTGNSEEPFCAEDFAPSAAAGVQ